MKIENINKEKCFFGCGQVGKYLFQNGRYCCSERTQQCPGARKKSSDAAYERNKGTSKISILREKISNGELKCSYCGETANYIKSYSTFCCSEKTTHCPEYSNWCGAIQKQKFIDNPEYRENMSKAMKECQNRPEVKEKKRESMTKLHNEDCIPCREFQENYKKGYEKGRDNWREILEKRKEDENVSN